MQGVAAQRLDSYSYAQRALWKHGERMGRHTASARASRYELTFGQLSYSCGSDLWMSIKAAERLPRSGVAGSWRGPRGARLPLRFEKGSSPISRLDSSGICERTGRLARRAGSHGCHVVDLLRVKLATVQWAQRRNEPLLLRLAIAAEVVHEFAHAKEKI